MDEVCQQLNTKNSSDEQAGGACPWIEEICRHWEIDKCLCLKRSECPIERQAAKKKPVKLRVSR